MTKTVSWETRYTSCWLRTGTLIYLRQRLKGLTEPWMLGRYSLSTIAGQKIITIAGSFIKSQIKKGINKEARFLEVGTLQEQMSAYMWYKSGTLWRKRGLSNSNLVFQKPNDSSLKGNKEKGAGSAPPNTSSKQRNAVHQTWIWQSTARPIWANG